MKLTFRALALRQSKDLSVTEDRCCSISDWVLLDYEFSRLKKKNSEDLNEPLKSYAMTMEFFRWNFTRLLSGGRIERGNREIC